MRDEFRVFIHEDRARRAEIEFGRFVAEELAMHSRPDKAAVGVDIDFCDAEFGSWKILVFIHASGVGIELTASGIDAFDFLLRNA